MAQQGDDNSSSDDDDISYAMMVNMYSQYQSLMTTAQQNCQNTHGGTSSSRNVIEEIGFLMRRELFLRIMRDIVHFDDYFKQKEDAAQKPGFSPYVKMTTALRMLAYRYPADANDDYLKVVETTSLEALKRFCRAINSVYGDEYLRRSNNADMARLLRKTEERGFPGMLGSVDCMHWEWKNCTIGWAGIYTGRHGHPTIILEAVASYDTWIWHSYFGPPGAFNDLNVLYSSPIFNDVLEGTATRVRHTVNGREYNREYYLADGIYPRWSTFVQVISNPQGRDKKIFTRMQEAYRKDVERAFGILQAKFEIIKGACRFWHEKDIAEFMKCCIVLHNMIVEDNRNVEGEDFVDDLSRYHLEEPPVVPTRYPITIIEYLSNRSGVTDADQHFMLRNDLVEHVWKMYRDGNLNF